MLRPANLREHIRVPSCGESCGPGGKQQVPHRGRRPVRNDKGYFSTEAEVRIQILAVFWAAMLSLATLPALTQSSEHNPLRIVADIPLPGAAVRFDYQYFDSSQGRLYIAHMN